MSKKNLRKEQILSLLGDQPGLSATQVALSLAVSRVTAYSLLQTLRTEQLVRILGQGKATRYFLQNSSWVRGGASAFTPSDFQNLKAEIIFALEQKYDEVESEEMIERVFMNYCMYITPDNSIVTGFEAFILWCTDPRHAFGDRIVEKAVEYLDITSRIEFLRNKNGFIDGAAAARANLSGYMEVGFDRFYFCMPSVLEGGFGRTRPAQELYYGKLNGNAHLIAQAIEPWSDAIRSYLQTQSVDACIFTPPTQGRNVQFRDILEQILELKLRVIQAEKVPSLGRILIPQKVILDKSERIKNALDSIQVTIPDGLSTHKHIVIFDDSFTTGATPNAIALKLREADYTAEISIITLCGSRDYDLAISEDEI